MIRLICTLVAVLMPLKALAIEIQEVTSPGGITAWLVEEDSIPFTALDIRFSGGANEEPMNQRGVTYLMMGLLEEGSADLDSQGFAEAAETLAARMSFDANNDSVSVGISFLTENRDASIALLRDALTDPTFDQAAVERVRDQVLAGLAAAARDPQEIASKTFAGLSFPGHPYGMPLEGTPETVSALTIADLRAAHARALTRDQVQVGVTGDITAEELGPLLDTLLGGSARDRRRTCPDGENHAGRGGDRDGFSIPAIGGPVRPGRHCVRRPGLLCGLRPEPYSGGIGVCFAPDDRSA